MAWRIYSVCLTGFEAGRDAAGLRRKGGPHVQILKRTVRAKGVNAAVWVVVVQDA